MLKARTYTILSLLLLNFCFFSQVAKAESTKFEDYKLQGDLAREAGEIEKAKALYEKAIELNEIPKEQDNNVAEILGQLGEIYFSKKEYQKAKDVLQRALNILVLNLGPNDSKVATALTRLAGIYWHLENGPPVAQALYFRALMIREQELGEKHPEVADSLMTFGGSLDYPYGRLSLTIPYWERALAIREENFGPNDLKVADSLSALAFLYDLYSDFETAQAFYERALDIREKALGPMAKDVLQSVYNLGTLYGMRGNETGGEEYENKGDKFFKKHIAIFEENLGPDHPALSQILLNYSSWLFKTGRGVEVE